MILTNARCIHQFIDPEKRELASLDRRDDRTFCLKVTKEGMVQLDRIVVSLVCVQFDQKLPERDEVRFREKCDEDFRLAHETRSSLGYYRK